MKVAISHKQKRLERMIKMNQLAQMFNYQDGQQVRTVSIELKPWFVLKDVCNILEITNVTETLKRLEEDEFSTTEVIDSIGRSQEVYIVNEYGLYSLVMTSRKKQAKEFKRWVTHDVLPSIRQTGSYVQTNTEQPELLQKVNELETKLNSFVTLDSHEQQLLQKAIARRVYSIIEEKEKRHLAFAELHREIRDRFGVPSYRDVAKLDFQKGLQYIGGWIPKKVAS
jgi:prophage antirepressor-like protein